MAKDAKTIPLSETPCNSARRNNSSFVAGDCRYSQRTLCSTCERSGHPRVEDVRHEFDGIVETAVNKGVLVKPAVRPRHSERRRSASDRSSIAIGQITIFSLNPGFWLRERYRIGNAIVDRIRARSARPADVADLHGRRTVGQNLDPGSERRPGQINQDFDCVLMMRLAASTLERG